MIRDNLDRLLSENCERNIEKLDGLGNIDIPDLDRVLNNFRHANGLSGDMMSAPAAASKKRPAAKPIKRLSIIAASTLILFLTSSMLSILTESPQVKAFRFRLIKTIIEMKEDTINIFTTNEGNAPMDTDSSSTSTSPDSSSSTKDNPQKVLETISLEQIKDKVVFPVTIPAYLPEGFTIKEVKLARYIDGTTEVTQIYHNTHLNTTINVVQASNWTDVNLSTVAPVENDFKKITVMGEEALLISGRNDSKHVTWFKNDNKHDIAGNMSEQELLKVIASLKYSK